MSIQVDKKFPAVLRAESGAAMPPQSPPQRSVRGVLTAGSPGRAGKPHLPALAAPEGAWETMSFPQNLSQRETQECEAIQMLMGLNDRLAELFRAAAAQVRNKGYPLTQETARAAIRQQLIKNSRELLETGVDCGETYLRSFGGFQDDA